MIELINKSRNASSGLDVASVIANSAREEQVERTSFKNACDRNNAFC